VLSAGTPQIISPFQDSIGQSWIEGPVRCQTGSGSAAGAETMAMNESAARAWWTAGSITSAREAARQSRGGPHDRTVSIALDQPGDRKRLDRDRFRKEDGRVRDE
jgi:hypothetical protein